MSSEFKIYIDGQPYFNSKKTHKVPVFFTLPDDSVPRAEGANRLCLLISGFGGEATANVYKKIRRQYSDKYNLIMIQCDYFGTKYMGKRMTREINKIYSNIMGNSTVGDLLYAYENDISLSFDSDICKYENSDDFCEMGIFQALDCIRAVKTVMKLLDNMKVNYNKQILGYGFSHGAYLLYLINAICPNLISCLIDNSAWLFPRYYFEPRVLDAYIDLSPVIENYNLVKKDNFAIKLKQRFNAQKYIDDFDIYILPRLYEQMENKARIISFHGEDDQLILLDDKMRFLNLINNVDLHIIDKSKVDGNVFGSTTHGLQADFLKFFDYVWNLIDINENQQEIDIWYTNKFKTEKYMYYFEDNEYISIKREPL